MKPVRKDGSIRPSFAANSRNCSPTKSLHVRTLKAAIANYALEPIRTSDHRFSICRLLTVIIEDQISTRRRFSNSYYLLQAALRALGTLFQGGSRFLIGCLDFLNRRKHSFKSGNACRVEMTTSTFNYVILRLLGTRCFLVGSLGRQCVKVVRYCHYAPSKRYCNHR